MSPGHDEDVTADIIPLSSARRARAELLSEGNYTFHDCDGTPITLQLRETFLACPGACNAVGGDPRRAGPAVALTRCGHVTTGWTRLGDFAAVAQQLRVRYVEEGGWNDSHHLWGRLCDGPPGEPARGDAVRQLREAWPLLLGCWLPDVDAAARLQPDTRFEPIPAGAWRATPLVRDEAFVTRRGALAVASGWDTFCAVNIPERGYRAHLQPLGLTYEQGIVRGALPAHLDGTGQRNALLCSAWLRALEAWAGG